MTPTVEIPTPYNAYRTEVKKDWIDYNGHLNVGYYHVAFDLAVEPFFNWLGMTDEFRQSRSASTFALETHLNFLREVREGDELRFESRLIAYDNKRIHFYQEMFHADEGYLAASHESLGAYIDMSKRKTAAIPDEITARLQVVLEAHSVLEKPWQLGHRISVKK